jgi:hypothetical protein
VRYRIAFPMNSSANPVIETKLRRIERVSTILRAVCGALIVPTVVLTVAVVVMSFISADANLSYYGQTIPMKDLSGSGRVIVALLALASGAIGVKALWHLRRLAHNYSRREIFTADSARQLRSFGISCMLWGIAKVAWAFLPLMAFTHRGQPVHVSGDTFVLGCIIVLLSWFAEMAASIREENELTI